MGFFEKLTRSGVKKLIQSMMTTATDVITEKSKLADAVAVKNLNSKIPAVNVIDDVYTFNGGSTTISNIKTNKFIITVGYGRTSECRYLLFTQYIQNTQVINVYARNYDGTTPANGTQIPLRIVYFT